MKASQKRPVKERIPGEPPPPKFGGHPSRPAKVDPAESAFRDYPQGEDGRPIIDDDPLKRLFASNGVQVVGNPDDSMPEEIAAFISKNNFAARYFCVVLREIPEGGDIETQSHQRTLKTFTRTIPTMEYIARHYGPGQYVFHISWHEMDVDTGKKKEAFEEIPFEISKKLEFEHLEFLRQRKIESAKMQNEEVARIRMDARLNDSIMSLGDDKKTDIDPRESAKAYIQEIAGAAEMLGFKRSASEGGGMNLEKIMGLMPLLAPVFGGIVKMLTDSAQAKQQQWQQMMMLMLTQSKESNQQLLEVAKIQNGQGSGMAMVNEFKQMVMGAMDMKEMMKGNKETVLDKICGVAEAVLPQLLSVAAQSRAAQAVDPRVAMAKAFVQSEPNLKQLYTDPVVLQGFIQRWDEHYGWLQTDSILTVAGLERPATCPREESQRLPMDQRGLTPGMNVEDEVEAEDGEMVGQ